MPDWTFITFIRPALRTLPVEHGRQICLGALQRIASLPGGAALISFLGHTTPSRALASCVFDQPIASPVGLGCRLDPEGKALRGFGHFGFGWIMVGPVGSIEAAVKCRECGSIPGSVAGAPTGPWNVHAGPVDADVVLDTLRKASRRATGTQVFLRIDSSFPAERLIEFEPFVSAYIASYPFESGGEVDRLARMVRKTGSKPVLLSIPLDASGRSLGSGDLREVVDFQQHLGARGIVIELNSQVPQRLGCHPEIRHGDPAEAHRVEEILRQLKTIAGEEILIVASGAPSVTHALRWFKAGAGLVGIDTALYCVGPGLTKRIHAGLLYDRNDESKKKENECVVSEECDREAWRLAWFWAGALGTAMFGGGILAMIIAFTRVMLPYDEAITGLSRDEIAGLNPRLLDFMAHDRVSLAGTMISCAVLYLSLAWYGMRRGLHWAKMTVVGSATAGFFSFFLFLGFGYFDPFHAFVTACLLQLLVLTLYAPLPKVMRWPAPGLKDDRVRTRGLWGQLLMICFGVALVVAGGVISWIGMTHVFVAEDLAYLGMTDGVLRSVHPWLVPLIAHDRAALGGMLMACGLGVWLTAQWGFGAGARWVWWTLLFGGTPAIIAAIGVHLWVGYTDPAHLAPAFAGAALFYGALWLAFDWLHISSAQRHERWKSLIEGKSERSA